MQARPDGSPRHVSAAPVECGAGAGARRRSTREDSDGGRRPGLAPPPAGIGKTEKNRRLRGGIWGEIREEEEEGYLAGAGRRTVMTRGT